MSEGLAEQHSEAATGVAHARAAAERALGMLGQALSALGHARIGAESRLHTPRDALIGATVAAIETLARVPHVCLSLRAVASERQQDVAPGAMAPHTQEG